jgi:hypothetical protein
MKLKREKKLIRKKEKIKLVELTCNLDHGFRIISLKKIKSI